MEDSDIEDEPQCDQPLIAEFMIVILYYFCVITLIAGFMPIFLGCSGGRGAKQRYEQIGNIDNSCAAFKFQGCICVGHMLCVM